ncbi:Signal transduction histidine kinase [Dyadobacter soli]|uniref:histidine kinase n=1 Tax=Dyadobacter soli TaxID=659014 RepID=A0A1G7VFK6_9BACT|nr:HAMP domain-containing sensor histidine kinase [Dyadobacter soli]SDG58612.1 Signal transduction histidine kinase [Dyadobacter soli]
MVISDRADGVSAGHLTTFLAGRRQDLLNDWRAACEHDFSLKGAATLTKKQFINQVPVMLDMLGARLDGGKKDPEINSLASQHGLHRWERGYSLASLSAEMQHLGRLLLGELRAFWQLYPSTSSSEISTRYEQLFEFGNQINTGSISQYADLQRQAAASRVEALEKALTELNEIGKQRSDLLRNSSHDLRGSFGTLQGAAALLELVIGSDQERRHVLEILRRNLGSCHTMVTQLMDLARLEAGKETAQIRLVDVGDLLTALTSTYLPLAAERGLEFKSDGPASLLVDCDPLLLQRIIQNLVLNALKHTTSGWVSVCWAMTAEGDWTVTVQDTGPGLPKVDDQVAEQLPTPCSADDHQLRQMALGTTTVSAFAHKGEGIGLSIVKRLCELLRADLTISSQPGLGTTFQIRFVARWGV